MQQKIIQIGNSSGVTLPQAIKRQIGLKPGDKVEVKAQGSDIVISPIRKTKTGGVDAKFMKMADEFINEHEDVLRELASR